VLALEHPSRIFGRRLAHFGEPREFGVAEGGVIALSVRFLALAA